MDCLRVFEVGPDAANKFDVEPDLIAGLVREHFGDRLVRRRLPRLTAQHHITEDTINADGSNKMIVMLVEE